MGLATLVERILALQGTSPGSNLATMGVQQLEVQLWPPFTRLEIEVFPLANTYMNIAYGFSFSPSMVPSAFFASGFYTGSRLSSGKISSWWLEHTADTFVYITEANPGMYYIENLTNLNQYYCGHTYYITIPTKENWDLIQAKVSISALPDREI